MTRLLEKAFREAAKMSSADQDALARLVLAELESERAWSRAFEESQDALASLGQAALKEDEKGETEDLDPSKL